MKVVRMSALRTDRLVPPGSIPGIHFCPRLSRPQGQRIISIRNSNDSIGNRTRTLQACSACTLVLIGYILSRVRFLAAWAVSIVTRNSLHRKNKSSICIMLCCLCTPFVWMQRTLRKRAIIISLLAENCWLSREYDLLLYELLPLSASDSKRYFDSISSFDTNLCDFGTHTHTA